MLPIPELIAFRGVGTGTVYTPLNGQISLGMEFDINTGFLVKAKVNVKTPQGMLVKFRWRQKIKMQMRFTDENGAVLIWHYTPKDGSFCLDNNVVEDPTHVDGPGEYEVNYRDAPSAPSLPIDELAQDGVRKMEFRVKCELYLFASTQGAEEVAIGRLPWEWAAVVQINADGTSGLLDPSDPGINPKLSPESLA